MTIIQKLTLRQLKLNKRRTLVTLIAISLSVTMMAAVTTAANSFLELMIRRSIAEHGTYHVVYYDIDPEDVSVIQTHPSSKLTSLTLPLGPALIEELPYENKPYVFVQAYKPDENNLFNVVLKEGRYPEAKNELLIPEHLPLGLKIGDTLTLDVGEYSGTVGDPSIINTTSYTYTITGIMEQVNFEDDWSDYYGVLTYLDDELLASADTFNVSVTHKHVSKQIFNDIDEIAKELHIFDETDIRTNDELLKYSGFVGDWATAKTLYTLAVFILILITLASAYIIHSSFTISLTERRKHLAMLSTVGATPKQKRQSIFFEAGLLGLLAIPIGLIAGVGGIAVTFKFINPIIQTIARTELDVRAVVSPLSLGLTILFTCIMLFLSAFSPALKAAKISSMDLLRQQDAIKLSHKIVKTSKLTRRIFGLEGELGLKNIKRHRRRYITIVSSLAMSIILFITISSFVFQMMDAYDVAKTTYNYDIRLADNGAPGDEYKDFYNAILKLDNIEASSVHQIIGGKTNDNRNIHFIGIDDNQFKNQFGDILTTTDSPYQVLITQSSKLSELDTLKATLDFYDQQIEYDFTIIDETDYEPLGYFEPNDIVLITNLSTFNRLLSNSSVELHFGNPSLYLSTPYPLQLEFDIMEIKDVMAPYIIQFENVPENMKDQQDLLVFIAVFGYGFITLITAICFVNIFNMISSTLDLRQKEFAMLQSVGLTPKSLKKMLVYENLFYVIKSLLYGLPISFVLILYIYDTLRNNFPIAFSIPWLPILFLFITLILFVLFTIKYTLSRQKKLNLIEALKNDNI